MHRVLIAEDDRRVRSSLERALTLEGYEVVTAGDGASALQLHTDRPADLLILDVSMPNADGLSVCRRLRAQGDDTPVLMLTARHEVHDRVAGLDAGPGIPEADRSRVFDRFHRVEATLRMPGSGLGLAIVKQVAEAHGGSVSATEAPGGGAAVGFAVPTVDD